MFSWWYDGLFLLNSIWYAGFVNHGGGGMNDLRFLSGLF